MPQKSSRSREMRKFPATRHYRHRGWKSTVVTPNGIRRNADLLALNLAAEQPGVSVISAHSASEPPEIVASPSATSPWRGLLAGIGWNTLGSVIAQGGSFASSIIAAR